MEKTIFKISGFHCEACVRLSTMKIRKISDVHDVAIASDGTARVCAERVIALDEIIAALDGLGYTVAIAKREH